MNHKLPKVFPVVRFAAWLICLTTANAGSPSSHAIDQADKARAKAGHGAKEVMIGGAKASAFGIIAKLRNEPGRGNAAAFAAAMERKNLKVGRKFGLVPGLQLLVPKAGAALQAEGAESVEVTIKELRESGLFEYVEPDWILHVLQAPTDTAFTNGSLWGLRNTGQNGGVAGVDVNAVAAWGITTGSPSVVVGVIDTGIRYTHQDLAANMWVNPGETLNGLDDDGNGYIDDIHGINAITGSGNPMDDNDHGSHCAGTIAAAASNGGQHVGVAYNVRLMGLKFLDAQGSGRTSDAITCVEYAIQKGVDILSNSWGGGGYSQATRDVIQAANNAGILFVAAAGNSSSNNDISPNYPSNYDVPNVIAVAAIDRTGALAGFSSYGATTVDIGAPGVAILSCTSASNTSYASFNGTSMATPHVAGAAALIASRYPGIGIAEMRNRLLNTAEPLSSLSGRVATGGMVDAHAALTLAASGTLALRATSNGQLEAGVSTDIYIQVTDLLPVTGATVSANFDGGAPVAFLDNGIGPDSTPNDGIYSARLLVPAGTSTVNLNVQASAPGKNPAGMVFPFSVIGRPQNDNFANRMLLASGTTQTNGTNSSATRESGEPVNPTVAGGRTVWWSWIAPSSASVTISTTGSDFDTTLAIYQGATLGGLSLVGANDDSSGVQSAVTFNATAGVSYQIQVDGYAANQGSIQLNYPAPGAGGGQSPVIVTQPVGRTVLVGAAFSLSVSATGSAPLSYVWSLNNVPISGATSATYSVTAANETHQGNYTVKVSNGSGFTVSNPAFVAVDLIGLVPENDNFANASILGGSSGTVSGSNIRATGEPFEPNHAGASGTLASVWYRWTAPSNGTFTINTFGSDFDTTLAAYTGSSLATLIERAANDDASGVQSEVSLAVTAGTSYSIAVDGFSSREGSVSLEYGFVPDATTLPNDQFANRIALTGSQTVVGTNIGATGENAEPNHAGASNPQASVWWSWTASANGQVTINTLGSDFDTTLAVYTGQSLGSLNVIAANDDSGGLQSQVTFDAVAGVSYSIAVDGYGSSQGSISLRVVPVATGVPNDQFAARIALTGSQTVGGSNIGATGENGEPNHAGASNPLASVWWSWTAPANGQVTINTFDSDFDTTLAAYTGQSVNSLTVIAENDDSGGLRSQVTFDVAAGVSYSIAVDGFGSSAGIISLSVVFTPDTPPGVPFDAWAGTFTDLSDSDPILDFDVGGLATALEWVLGGDPTDPGDDATIAPTFDNRTDPDFFIFTYRRDAEANADANTAIAVKYGSDLVGWNTALAGPNVAINATVDGAEPGIDLVEVRIRRTLAVQGKLFVRLSVTITEP